MKFRTYKYRCESDDTELAGFLKNRIAISAYGKAEDIANVVAFLAKE